MKSKPYILMFFFALIGGIALLAFAKTPDIGRSVVMAIGILSVVASAYTLLVAAFSKTKYGSPAKEDEAATVKTSLLIPAVAGLVFGLILVCMPGFFAQFLIYTYAVMFLICGLTQFMYITSKMGKIGTSKGFLLMPLLTIGAGVLYIICWHNPELSSTMTLATGIILICFGANGLAGAAHKIGKMHLYKATHLNSPEAVSAPYEEATEEAATKEETKEIEH